MLIRCDDGRGCKGVKDAAEEKEHDYECQQECEACLYEAKGSWVDGALHLQNFVPEPGMTNARGFATLGQVDDVEIRFFLCLRFCGWLLVSIPDYIMRLGVNVASLLTPTGTLSGNAQFP
jgi:hypothetical protein